MPEFEEEEVWYKVQEVRQNSPQTNGRAPAKKSKESFTVIAGRAHSVILEANLGTEIQFNSFFMKCKAYATAKPLHWPEDVAVDSPNCFCNLKDD